MNILLKMISDPWHYNLTDDEIKDLVYLGNSYKSRTTILQDFSRLLSDIGKGDFD